MAEQNREKLGSYLRGLRRRKRLSLRQVQEETRASSSYLSQVEQGKRHPSARLLRKIAPTYGTSVGDLLAMAGYLNEPEVNMSDQERIEWAFKCVVSDPRNISMDAAWPLLPGLVLKLRVLSWRSMKS